MIVPQIHILAVLLVCLTALAGCNRSNDAEIAKLKAEAEAAKAKDDTELAKTKADPEPAKADQAQPQPVDVNRKAADWILNVGGNMRLIADGVPIEIPYDGKLPDSPFEIESVYLPAFQMAGNPKVTDQGIQCLAGLAGVQKLNLVSIGQLSDFAFLEGMTNLREVQAAGTNLSDESLVHMKGLMKLTMLSLDSFSENRISDVGLENIKGMIELKNLGLTGAGISDAGLEQVKGLSKLEYLAIGSYVDKSRISDSGLKHISDMGELRRLTIVMTDASDAGLEYFKKLPNLQVLRLEKTKATEAGVESLKKALPKCEIQFVAR